VLATVLSISVPRPAEESALRSLSGRFVAVIRPHQDTGGGSLFRRFYTNVGWLHFSSSPEVVHYS
jgi:hypothetical protein